ncbi:MAG: sulfatase-like hydrolase/transferase [Planctomycetes bacterium]|nr:sulfatase-like hydrolase/transferase [Planctomycetota bacterium]
MRAHSDAKMKPFACGTLTRRQFLHAGAAAATVGGRVMGAPAFLKERRPNLLFINTDQQGLDTLSAYGCPGVNTPNMDRLVAGGTSFMESYAADPVCCPSRASWFTGRPPAENGVVMNSVPIEPDMPDLGQWFTENGYDSVYAGKWHVSGRNNAESFRVLPGGTPQGELGDAAVSRACQGFLLNRSPGDPFFLTAGLLQPHDICYWIMQHHADIGELPYPELADQLPELPPNFHYDPREPERLKQRKKPNARGGGTATWSELHWRYYIWSYLRHVEMVDAEIGRILDALEDSEHVKDTVVVFTSDHGEGRARHQMVTKGYLYDEAAKVPLVVSWPGQIGEGRRDGEHLVSGLDFAPTVCDYAGIAPPPKCRGRSLRPILEGANVSWREFVVASSAITGRMVRTADYKYVTYRDDPTDQLFHMKDDPWETKNLAGRSEHESIVADHRKLLADYEAPFELAPIRKPATRRRAPSKRAGKKS